MENRIEYSQEQMMLSLETALDELNAFRYDSKFRSVLGETFIEKLSGWERDIRIRKEDPFTIVVIGDFKRGKSTLINALLGEEIVTTDVTTETVTLNKISYGAHSNEAVLSGSRRARLSDNELKREELESVIAQLGEPVQRLELKRPCDILKKVTIIDTPGTGDAMKDFSDMVQESLIQADAVIYVYNVQYPLSKSEQLFLKSAVLPQKFTKLFLVGNYADVLGSPEEYHRVREFLNKRIESILPNTDVYMISALDELCQKLGEDSRKTDVTPIIREQFETFRAALEQLIEEKADTVTLSRMQRLTDAMLHDLGEELDSIEKGLNMSDEEARKALQSVKDQQDASVETQTHIMQEIDKIVRAMKIEANAWMGEFIQRISDESAGLRDFSADDLKKYYEFYCIDLLQEAMNTCLDYHQDKMYDYLDDISQELGNRIAGIIPEKRTYSFRINLDNRIWTKGDTVGLVAAYASNFGVLGTVASMITDGITGAMREKEAADRTPELVSQIAKKLTGLNITVTETITKQYDILGDSAKALVLDYYEEEMEKTKHFLEQSAQIANKNIEEKERLKAVVVQARGILEKIQSVIA